MKIIRIEEENHGTICIAADYKSAIAFLINEGWLFDEVQVYDKNWENWKPIRIIYGDNWRDMIKNKWSAKRFNDAFDGLLYLHEETIYNMNEGEKK